MVFIKEKNEFDMSDEMIIEKTKKHFDDISRVWENKIWVNDDVFDKRVISLVNTRGNEIALEVGIGTGAFAKKFNVKEMYGVDISKGMMELAPIPRQHLIEGKAEHIPFLNDTFDIVLSRNLFKHLSDPFRALKEMYRVLKENGKLVIVESTPIEKEHTEIPTRAVRIVEPYHPKFISHKELIDMIKKLHFKDFKSDIFIFRRKWLKKWCKAKRATEKQRNLIFELYKNAPETYKKGQHVELFENEKEILSDFPWSIIIAIK